MAAPTMVRTRLRVAFAGHRTATDSEALRQGLHTAFALAVKASALPSIPADQAIWLHAGLAPGADEIAIDVWRGRGLGPVHALMPFRHPDAALADAGATIAPQLLDPTGLESRAGRLVTGLDAAFDAWTVLDGADAEAQSPPRNAHLQQARWLVRWADLVVVAWDGDRPGGAGGTADTVSLAIQRGLPVLWVASTPPHALRLIDPEALSADLSLLELVDAIKQVGVDKPFLRQANVEELRPLLAARLAPEWTIARPEIGASKTPGWTPRRLFDDAVNLIGLTPPRLAAPHEEPAHDLVDEVQDYARYQQTETTYANDPTLKTQIKHTRVIRGAYDSFKRRNSRPFQIFGGYWIARETEARRRLQAEAATRPEPAGVNIEATARIDADYARADAISNLISAQHRSEQLWLLRLAALAVAVGALPVLDVLAGREHWLAFKCACVAVEFLILMLMLQLWRAAEHARRHHLWSDARRFAERLRAVRAAWPLGIDAKDAHADPPGAWTELRTQTLLRDLGPPRGVISQAYLLEAAARARGDIVQGQAKYHEANAQVMHRVHRRLETQENILFVALALGLALFFVVSLIPAVQAEGREAWIKIGSLLLFASAVFPAIGATGIALEAKLEFGGIARRSAALEPRFRRIDGQLAAALGEGPGGRVSALTAVELVRDAARLLITDVDAWRDELERRKIIRGP